MQPHVLILSLCALIFFVAGGVLFLFPPKKINSWYGYRTPKSMKNQGNWDFAQKHSGKQMMKGGLIFGLLTFGFSFFSVNETWGIIIGLGVLLSVAAITISQTETALKKRMKDEN